MLAGLVADRNAIEQEKKRMEESYIDILKKIDGESQRIQEKLASAAMRENAK